MTTPIDNLQSLIFSEKDEARINQKDYQKRVKSLMYAMVTTRPDIAYAVEKLSQFCSDPVMKHRIALNRIFRYLRGTIDLVLLYDNSAAPIAYADSFYGDDSIDRKSTYENTLLIGNGAVTWVSKKNRSIAISIIEVEYVAMCQASKNVV